MESGTLRRQGPDVGAATRDASETKFVMRPRKQRGELIHRAGCSSMVKRAIVELLFQIGQHGVYVRWVV